MFVDEVKIKLQAGKGGNGIVAYRRELKVERGGPFGGTGGRGGDIVFEADEGLQTLLDLRYNKIIKGNDGENGRNKGMNGANAEDTIIRVPVGTIVFEAATNKVIADFTSNKQRQVISYGGRGGRGNMAFATGTNKCPDFAEKGEPGQEIEIRCELKVLADCGLVGFPSVGKSTLISAVSAARPKIAAYHFTTLSPNLGMVRVDDYRSFVMADLPGLIEGASQGLGLGFQFLRHIERCRVIVHVIDMAAVDGRDPYEDYLAIRKELKEYKMNLLNRPEIIVANKMDLEGAKENLERFKKQLNKDAKIYEISAMAHQNLQELVYAIADTLNVTEKFSLYEKEDLEYVEYKFVKEEEWFKITKNEKAGVFEVTGDRLRKLFDMTDFSHDSGIARFARQLRSLGLDDKLRSYGVKNGDTVRIFSYEFEFID